MLSTPFTANAASKGVGEWQQSVPLPRTVEVILVHQHAKTLRHALYKATHVHPMPFAQLLHLAATGHIPARCLAARPGGPGIE